MSLVQIAIAYPLTAVFFLALDAVWLGTMAERLYRPFLGHLMVDRFAWAPAAIFYVLYVAGIVFFAVAPGLESRRASTALGLGALLGLLAYATYDLTNQATLKGWPWQVTVVDLCWGSFATAVAAALACQGTLWIQGWLGRG